MFLSTAGFIKAWEFESSSTQKVLDVVNYPPLKR